LIRVEPGCAGFDERGRPQSSKLVKQLAGRFFVDHLAISASVAGLVVAFDGDAAEVNRINVGRAPLDDGAVAQIGGKRVHHRGGQLKHAGFGPAKQRLRH